MAAILTMHRIQASSGIVRASCCVDHQAVLPGDVLCRYVILGPDKYIMHSKRLVRPNQKAGVEGGCGPRVWALLKSKAWMRRSPHDGGWGRRVWELSGGLGLDADPAFAGVAMHGGGRLTAKGHTVLCRWWRGCLPKLVMVSQSAWVREPERSVR